MKRYQCIKNWYYLSVDSDDNLLFKVGTCYPETNEKPYLPGNVVIRCEYGHGIQVTPDVIKTYFQELLDLHVDDIPRDEADRELFTTPEPRRKLTAGWAWFIAMIITIGFFILKAFTE